MAAVVVAEEPGAAEAVEKAGQGQKLGSVGGKAGRNEQTGKG